MLVFWACSQFVIHFQVFSLTSLCLLSQDIFGGVVYLGKGEVIVTSFPMIAVFASRQPMAFSLAHLLHNEIC